MNLTVEDLENLQLILQEKQLDYKLELVDGKIQVMGLSDYISEVIIARLIFLLQSWVLPRQLGYVTGSSAGFRLPNGNLRGPDVSFVSAARLNPLPRSFAEIVPDLMVEVKSASDSIPPLQKKIQMFLELGTQVGILIDPDKLTVTVYRSTGEAIVLTENDMLTIPELFPGWELPISEIWPQVF
ncbi:Uma2 family endonuclease [Planktothrix sp. FACHB-1355]|uniref:Uma2 family endonuclease n=1 Tax=Aerosakkonema funiforme FACHB-1375 TaxID=2949571 RepID=A0A926V9T7_9CYAN|nr:MULTISPECIES: Uma2 family endonuclease [Oscillatoriales]MBD2179929.1 Uma2 family endonuclease [Aerosakkonema funiforme FACHB-1375]MBD3560873.1 Uma2 family endonuclease [Planktothrix sp. FACHB-1355]